MITNLTSRFRKMYQAVCVILAAVFFVLVMASCMSDREYRLRKKEIEAKASYPPTYDVIRIEGPFEMKEGATLVAASPTPPWKDSNIPNGPELQRAVIRDIITGAIIGYVTYRVTRPTGDKTTINNYGTEQDAP